MLDSELKSKINKLWDIFWSGGISNPLQAIEQMSHLIFLKKLEDQDLKDERNSEFRNEPYESIFNNVKKDCEKHSKKNCGEHSKQDCKWSQIKQLSPEKILTHVQTKVWPFLISLGEKNELYKSYMKDSNFTIPQASLLIEAINIIDNLKIKEQNQDTQGDIYEYLLSELRTSGKNGQFRTPRHIIKLMTELANPKLGEKINDPACGTAGFLIQAYEHILKNNTTKELIKKNEAGEEYNYRGDKLNEREWEELKNETLYGQDFETTMVRISLMNLLMHGLKNPNIKQVNSLSTHYKQKPYYDLILANPPFKGSINQSELNEDLTISTKKTEILFLELMYNVLGIGGRCAVIVPDGILFGNSKAHKKIRKLIIKKCRLDAVISMPSGVFKPYAGVSTAIIYFTKGEPTKKVWFYDMENDGYSLDDKRTKIEKNDIPNIIKEFKEYEVGKEFNNKKNKCFTVNIEEIEKNDYDLSLNKYKEIEYEEENHRPTDQIIKDIEQKNESSNKGLIELKEDLKNINFEK